MRGGGVPRYLAIENLDPGERVGLEAFSNRIRGLGRVARPVGNSIKDSRPSHESREPREFRSSVTAISPRSSRLCNRPFRVFGMKWDRERNSTSVIKKDYPPSFDRR